MVAMKSALFVDFDNVYSGLRELDPAVADQFARQPMRWVDWLLHSLPPPEHALPGAKRRLLARRCYLNPQAYQRYRTAFNQTGFDVIDCPPLTSEGKTATDIHLVLDVVDLMHNEPAFDEFILFSADADFTPVLRKLRRADRRTTVLAIGFPAAAYRASADLLIDPAVFVREALGIELPVPAPAIPALTNLPPDDERLAGVEPPLRALILQVHQHTGAPPLAPAAFRALLEAVAETASGGAEGHAARAQDRLRANGFDIAASEIEWTLQNLLQAGHFFQDGQDDLRALSYKLAGYLVNLCRREQLQTEEGFAGAVHRWLSGKAA